MWLEHPKYVPARERLISYLTSDRYRFRRLAPVIFLCGGAGSARRDALKAYLQKHHPKLQMFYAERVWEHIAARADEGALKMESDLAALADLVLIVVESPGTFAELGAFSLVPPLRKKLLPIVDAQFEGSGSFLATGPLRWIDRESDFAPTIYVPLTSILTGVDQVQERIARIPKAKTTRVSDLSSSPKHLLFFLCDLVAVVHPVTAATIEYFLERILSGRSGAMHVSTLVGLAIAMGLLRTHVVEVNGESQIFIEPTTPHTTMRPFHHIRYLDLPSQRAEQMSVLQTIPVAREVLLKLRAGT